MPTGEGGNRTGSHTIADARNPKRTGERKIVGYLPWAADTTYNAGDIILENNHLYQVPTGRGGMSDSAAHKPTFPTTPGQTVLDGIGLNAARATVVVPATTSISGGVETNATGAPGYAIYHQWGNHYVWVSTDYGATWSGPVTVAADGSVLYVLIVSPTLMFVFGRTATAAKIWRSTDGGLTWVEVCGIAGYFGFGRGITLDGVNIYACACVTATKVPHIYKSTDSGATWSDVKTLTAFSGTVFDFCLARITGTANYWYGVNDSTSPSGTTQAFRLTDDLVTEVVYASGFHSSGKFPAFLDQLGSGILVVGMVGQMKAYKSTDSAANFAAVGSDGHFWTGQYNKMMGVCKTESAGPIVICAALSGGEGTRVNRSWDLFATNIAATAQILGAVGAPTVLNCSTSRCNIAYAGDGCFLTMGAPSGVSNPQLYQFKSLKWECLS